MGQSRKQMEERSDQLSKSATSVRPIPRSGFYGRSERPDLARVQRARLLNAAAHVVDELGYGGMSVARVTARAGVSRRTFYELFGDREDCFLALFDDALARATVVARTAVSQEAGWRERVREGLSALLLFVTDEPVLGSLLVVGALGGGPKVLGRRARTLDELKAIVDEGRSEAKTGHEPPPLTAEGVVGAVLSVLHARLLDKSTVDRRNGSSRADPLIDLINPLMGMIVLPYLGQAAATKELARPIPRPSRAPGASWGASQMSPADALEGLDMRLTYRTLRVLSAIATEPGASNRLVADTAGVHDQGQISKLLNRLERLGLIVNAGNGQPRGEPNAWALTPKGQEVEQALSS
jgi:AcrR family transcriptional regulator/DNA-binding MarR family transcriptional regulator